ncbi:primary active transporter [Lithospermum erythrorhizon]|uniref:Primary active transporter n=1 Tax=Lithospermum erythrorhizon TaxID=34254 RepID=A0AAV3NV49_LITER
MNKQAKSSKRPSSATLRKMYPNELIVDNAMNYGDDNIVVALHPATMKKLQFFSGDAILIMSEKLRETVCFVVDDEACEEHKIRMSNDVRSCLLVRAGSVVYVFKGPEDKHEPLLLANNIHDNIDEDFMYEELFYALFVPVCDRDVII